MKTMPRDFQSAYFAGGCFWGVEYCFQGLSGVIATHVGYMGGEAPNPTYEQVCHGDTGHAETLEVIFDPKFISYDTLVKHFFEIHDPTQKDRQGLDIGTQYRSAIFYADYGQKETAEKVLALVREKGIDAVTEILPADKFYEAEEGHQRYYAKKGQVPYCHRRRQIF